MERVRPGFSKAASLREWISGPGAPETRISLTRALLVSYLQIPYLHAKLIDSIRAFR
jgi:hypothetical protein